MQRPNETICDTDKWLLILNFKRVHNSLGYLLNTPKKIITNSLINQLRGEYNNEHEKLFN